MASLRNGFKKRLAWHMRESASRPDTPQTIVRAASSRKRGAAECYWVVRRDVRLGAFVPYYKYGTLAQLPLGSALPSLLVGAPGPARLRLSKFQRPSSSLRV